MKNIREFTDGLQQLIDAQNLLNRILDYYDVYSGEFDNKRLKEIDEALGKTINSRESIKEQIRAYVKFDDSE